MANKAADQKSTPGAVRNVGKATKAREAAEDAARAKAEANTPRGRIKRYLIQRFYTRFHMSLILMSAGFAAMLSNWAMLNWGISKMWLRYPVAITLSYLTFLAGVWLWIQYVEFRRVGSEASADSLDEIPDGVNTVASKKSNSKKGDILDLDIPSGGGGGTSIEMPNILRGAGGSFDGGGASGDWVEANPVQAFASNASAPAPTPESSGFLHDAAKSIGNTAGDFFDLDGDAMILIVLAALLIGSVLFISGYIVWFAPDILSEAIFGATLAGGLARTAKRQDDGDWVMGVVKKTWWPFALVFAAAMAFAIYAQIHYPAAKTFAEALQMAIAG